MEFFRVLATSLGTQVRTVLAQLRGRGTEGDDDNAEAYDAAEVVTPIGFVSRPAASNKLEAVVYRLGDEAIVLAIIDKSMPALTSSDCDVGEALMYAPAAPTCRIKFTAGGAIQITASSGQDITLNGGTAKVGRVGDACAKNSQLTTWMSQVDVAINLLAPGAVSPLSATFSNVTTIAAGAANVKA